MNLFHYTNQTGLLGIFESKSLWTTKIQFLNDQQEMNLALEIAGSILDSRLEASDDDKQKFQLNRFKTNLGNIKKVNVCACSFTEDGDLLSQWRGYSDGVGGYSLGFDFEVLKQCFSKAGFQIEKCIYDKNEQRAKISSLIDDVMEEHHPDNETNVEILAVTSPSAQALLSSLTAIAPIIKHNAFSEEQEWRAFTRQGIDNKNLSFRTGASLIVPYLPVELGDNFYIALMEIFVGPNPDGESAAASITNLLLSKGARPKRQEPGGPLIVNHEHRFGVDVKLSSIPFRNW